MDNITDVPRSLNDPVGANHSSLKKHVAPANVEATNGVQPSPREICVSTSSGNDARYLQIDRVAKSICPRLMPPRGVSIRGWPDGDRQIGRSNGKVSLLRGSRYCPCVVSCFIFNGDQAPVRHFALLAQNKTPTDRLSRKLLTSGANGRIIDACASSCQSQGQVP